MKKSDPWSIKVPVAIYFACLVSCVLITVLVAVLGLLGVVH